MRERKRREINGFEAIVEAYREVIVETLERTWIKWQSEKMS